MFHRIRYWFHWRFLLTSIIIQSIVQKIVISSKQSSLAFWKAFKWNIYTGLLHEIFVSFDFEKWFQRCRFFICLFAFLNSKSKYWHLETAWQKIHLLITCICNRGISWLFFITTLLLPAKWQNSVLLLTAYKKYKLHVTLFASQPIITTALFCLSVEYILVLDKMSYSMVIQKYLYNIN